MSQIQLITVTLECRPTFDRLYFSSSKRRWKTRFLCKISHLYNTVQVNHNTSVGQAVVCIMIDPRHQEWKSRRSKAEKKGSQWRVCYWTNYCCGQLELTPARAPLANGVECALELFLHQTGSIFGPTPVPLCFRVSRRGVTSRAPLCAILSGCHMYQLSETQQ